ncbi:protein FAR1-RELATED SEQUENCE 5-like [Salvia splendens]|uniref:protein FAR1-RELATED SEQUENCE 5-like n=1 Tax=Salvia splendens TaxID=180675 RepID=UPI001C25EBDD|nr:protein FAR1-RELATED SEQUENCE 5-like [Salvia splendens]
MLSSQWRITEVQAHENDLADDVGLNQKSSFDLMTRQAGVRDGIGYTILDAKNYLRSKRQRSMVYDEADGARMLIDYEYFGDVVSLDTTYCTNRDNRPLAVFSGFNHHRRVVIFGASLLYDKTIASFKWLFETFLEVHKHKRHLTVFTDQDLAMAKALHEVMPETFHGLCTWHLMQNGIKHLGNLMKEGSYFLIDFKRCMFGFEDEIKFEEAWSNLLTQYNLQDSTWLKQLYSVKAKWARCYIKAFTIAAYIMHKDGRRSLFEYVIGLIDHDREWRVTYDPNTKMIHCSCRTFEMVGLICCHFVKVFDVLDVKLLPETYILKNWTKEARSGVVRDYTGNVVEEDSKLQCTEWYQRLCQMLIRLANEASVHQSTFSLVHETMHDLYKKVMEIRSRD